MNSWSELHSFHSVYFLQNFAQQNQLTVISDFDSSPITQSQWLTVDCLHQLLHLSTFLLSKFSKECARDSLNLLIPRDFCLVPIDVTSVLVVGASPGTVRWDGVYRHVRLSEKREQVSVVHTQYIDLSLYALLVCMCSWMFVWSLKWSDTSPWFCVVVHVFCLCRIRELRLLVWCDRIDHSFIH